ncbi:hypothetical protein DFQ30_002076 [Apophysomyces sp. BC1015]|nr:hypothetical protein DFQ30_002076 [Apophysomyces sp. BC1015]
MRYAHCTGGRIYADRPLPNHGSRNCPSRAEAADPVLDHFLGFLAQDIARHPERLTTVDTGFVQRLRILVSGVEALKKKDPLGYVKKNATQRLATITKLAFDVIPQDPA